LPLDVLKVKYTTSYMNSGTLKETPTEVTLVRRETTGKLVAVQVGLNILTLALGRTVAEFTSFSKDDLKGEHIEEEGDRTNLQNPVSTRHSFNHFRLPLMRKWCRIKSKGGRVLNIQF